MPRSACLLRPVEWPTGVRLALVRRAGPSLASAELTATATNGQQLRPATAHNARTIGANFGICPASLAEGRPST